ncbi:hypothetical protein [Bradyrhizobium sp. USDA 4473]
MNYDLPDRGVERLPPATRLHLVDFAQDAAGLDPEINIAILENGPVAAKLALSPVVHRANDIAMSGDVFDLF